MNLYVVSLIKEKWWNRNKNPTKTFHSACGFSQKFSKYFPGRMLWIFSQEFPLKKLFFHLDCAFDLNVLIPPGIIELRKLLIEQTNFLNTLYGKSCKHLNYSESR